MKSFKFCSIDFVSIMIQSFSSYRLIEWVHWFVFLLMLNASVCLVEANTDEPEVSVGEHLSKPITEGFDTKGVWIVGTGVVVTLLTQQLDGAAFDLTSDNQIMNKDMSHVGDILGTGIPGITIVALQFLVGDKNEGWAHLETLTWTTLSTFTLKYINQRERPNSKNRHSMPSGHTSTMFATATSLTYSYGADIGVPAYLLATLTAISRMSDNAHWLSDTAAGAFIGIFWGRAVAKHHISIAPEVDFAQSSFSLNCRFKF